MKQHQHMNKAELIRYIKTLERKAPGIAFEHERLLHELQVHQIELETQNRELREAQLLLEDSRDRYADLYDFSPVGYVTLDAKGVIREINLTAAGMLGVERTRLVGVPFHLHVARQDLAHFREHLARIAKREERVVTELHLARKGRSVLPVVMQSTMLESTGTKGFRSRTALTDITARQQAENELRDNEARLRAVLDTAVDGIITMDEGGAIESSNQAAEILFGYAAGETKGLNINRLITLSQGEELARCLAHYRDTGERTIIGLGHEASGLRKDGSTFPLELSVSEVRLGARRIFTGIVRDITRRKQAEQERHKFVSLVESSTEFIGICDLEFKPTYLNPAASRLIGLSALDARHIKVLDFFFPEDQSFIADKFFPRALRDGHREVQIRFRHFQTGAAVWMLYNVFTIRDAGGKPVGWATVSRDITERMGLERQILDISEREQRKFGQDLHDGLGQRLTGLEMWSNELTEKLKERSPALARQAAKLNRELRETVTEARLIAHGLAPIPLDGDGLMRGLAGLAASTSRIPGVKCRFVCPSPVQLQDVTVATHLYRIAQEAVNNALKHGHANRVDILLSEQAKSVELSVENNGAALPEHQPVNDGLGLSVMRYRAGMIGGHLTLGLSLRNRVRVACILRRKS